MLPNTEQKTEKRTECEYLYRGAVLIRERFDKKLNFTNYQGRRVAKSNSTRKNSFICGVEAKREFFLSGRVTVAINYDLLDGIFFHEMEKLGVGIRHA